ncbi:MAG: hypothetical protein ACJ8FY_01045 [Gemmataceae bacterium]
MVARGHVKNGVVVLDNGVQLPDGQEVTIKTSGRGPAEVPTAHSILDIPTVSVGAVLRPLISDDDLLGEMLEAQAHLR